MPDTYSREIRRRVMQAVRGRDTAPEMRLRRALHAVGLRGWRCSPRMLPGKPDVAFSGRRVAVFVDGAFWHGHPSKYWQGRSSPYWDKKIAGNQKRDRRIDRELAARGWRVVRLWDFEIEARPDAAALRVKRLLLRAPARSSARTNRPGLIRRRPTS
jgi:DNA mismatch endonuclease (patch repair protein)